MRLRDRVTRDRPAELAGSVRLDDLVVEPSGSVAPFLDSVDVTDRVADERGEAVVTGRRARRRRPLGPGGGRPRGDRRRGRAAAVLEPGPGRLPRRRGRLRRPGGGARRGRRAPALVHPHVPGQLELPAVPADGVAGLPDVRGQRRAGQGGGRDLQHADDRGRVRHRPELVHAAGGADRGPAAGREQLLGGAGTVGPAGFDADVPGDGGHAVPGQVGPDQQAGVAVRVRSLCRPGHPGQDRRGPAAADPRRIPAGREAAAALAHGRASRRGVPGLPQPGAAGPGLQLAGVRRLPVEEQPPGQPRALDLLPDGAAGSGGGRGRGPVDGRDRAGGGAAVAG